MPYTIRAFTMALVTCVTDALLPLSALGQDGRWYGFADAKRRMQQDAEFVGRDPRR